MNPVLPADPSPSPVFYACYASVFFAYPIDVGWASVDSSLTLVSESHLIRHKAWERPDRSLSRVERMYKLDLSEILCRGKTPYRIAKRMNAVLAGRELFANRVEDKQLLDMIFEAARFEPAFTVRRALGEVLVRQVAASRGIRPRTFAKLIAEVNKTSPRTWLAGPDARHLAARWLAVARSDSGKSAAARTASQTGKGCR